MTDIVLNQDVPGGVMDQLGDLAGGVTYDQYAPGGCVWQLYLASGLDDPLDQYAPGGPLHQIEIELESATVEPPGAERPDWVPLGAKVHIDFVGGDPLGRAWEYTDGVVDIATLLGNDPVADSWGTTVLNPVFLGDDGYHAPGGVALLGAAKTRVLAGCTMVAVFKELGDAGYSLIWRSDGGGAQLNINKGVGAAGPHDLEGVSSVGGWSQMITGAMNSLGTSSPPPLWNTIAATVTPTRAEFAGSSSAPNVAVLTSTQWPVEGADAIACFLISLINEYSALRSITLYAPKPSGTLTALSDTGIANTAPHDITFIWYGDVVTSSGATATYLGGRTGTLLHNMYVTDTEGNTLTWSMSDNAGGLVDVVLGGGGDYQVVLNSPLPDGPLTINFTVRVTDYWGLYVDQVFTVTVAALGADIVTNGTFASDTGWSKFGGATIAGGVAQFNGGPGADIEQTSATTIVAAPYYVSLDLMTANDINDIQVFVGGTLILSIGQSSSLGTYSRVFDSAAASQDIMINGQAEVCAVDNLVVRPVS